MMDKFRSACTRALLGVGVAIAMVVPVRAQDQGKPPGVPSTPLLTRAIQQSTMRFTLPLGRLRFSAGRRGNRNDIATNNTRSEKLNVRASGKQPSASYTMSSPEEEILLEVTEPNAVRIRRTPKGDTHVVPIELVQPAEGPLVLTLGPESDRQVLQGESIWHLLVIGSKEFRQHLVPLLAMLNRAWPLRAMAEEAERQLLAAVAEGKVPDPRHWAELIEQLGDPRFSRREAADRELRAFGGAVFNHLMKKLDPSQLDAEQQYRVWRITKQLAKTTQLGEPSAIAKWMAGDPAIWLALLEREEESTRRLALQALETLEGEPLPYDPGADPASRASQLEALRPRFSP